MTEAEAKLVELRAVALQRIRDLRALLRNLNKKIEDRTMSEQQITDAERQLLVVLVTKAWVEIRGDIEMAEHAIELENILRKINGVDKVLVVR